MQLDTLRDMLGQSVAIAQITHDGLPHQG